MRQEERCGSVRREKLLHLNQTIVGLNDIVFVKSPQPWGNVNRRGTHIRQIRFQNKHETYARCHLVRLRGHSHAKQQDGARLHLGCTAWRTAQVRRAAVGCCSPGPARREMASTSEKATSDDTQTSTLAGLQTAKQQERCLHGGGGKHLSCDFQPTVCGGGSF